MRLDDAGPRTWLLATAAAWALCAWLLAVFGMGGGIERLDEDASLLRPLPAAFKAAPERLGALQQYAEIGARPLFTEDRRPQPFLIDPMAEAGDASNDFDYVLTSVLRTPTLEMVILQPTGGGRSLGVKVGETPKGVPGWSLASVAARSAVFNGPQGERTLELRVFDGVGGEAPTPMAVQPPAQPPVDTNPANRQPDAVASAAMGDEPASAPVSAGPAARQQGAEDAMSAGNEGADRASQEQVEAIRKRIEERRARLRQAGNDESRKKTP